MEGSGLREEECADTHCNNEIHVTGEKSRELKGLLLCPQLIERKPSPLIPNVSQFTLGAQTRNSCQTSVAAKNVGKQGRDAVSRKRIYSQSII